MHLFIKIGTPYFNIQLKKKTTLNIQTLLSQSEWFQILKRLFLNEVINQMFNVTNDSAKQDAELIQERVLQTYSQLNPELKIFLVTA